MGTPFKRSVESPSPWKSPWFVNTFVPGPRVETDITIEVWEEQVIGQYKDVLYPLTSYPGICVLL